MVPRRRYIGGTGTLISCIDGDCAALDVLDAIGDLINEARGTTISMAELSRTVDRMRSRSRGLQVMEPILQDQQPKKKRKRSKYQMEFGRSMKALKRKHPRTPASKLMKRAHTMTKKKMRGKR